VTDGTTTPRLGRFRALARDRAVVPVVRRLLADAETPIGVYRKLAGARAGTFLLESAEHGRSWSRFSFVGVRCPATLSTRDGRAVWLGDPPPGVAFEPPGDDPLEALATVADQLRSSPDEREAGSGPLPPLTGGLVGYIGYDAVRRLERVGDDTADDLGLPELAMMLVADLAVLDHDDGSVLLIANTFGGEDPEVTYGDALVRLDAMVADLAKPASSSVSVLSRPDRAVKPARAPAGGYPAAVRRAKEHIRAGDVYQVVPSQRFDVSTSADPLDVYRALRASNPSPYMYLLRLPGGTDVVGSSPEAHVKVTGRRALLHPLAGTRPRGATPEADAALAADLLADDKERAEHVMLVDLGRNDLARVCEPGSVEVVEFMAVERYSRVMHIVSTVVGELAGDRTAYDALAATFPAGTLTGAPKVRAMQIIEELEPTRRGLYGGTVGYLDVGGDLDMAIAIRTAVMRDGTAYVQAGGGIVADSDPAAEDAESRAKAAAVLAAIAAAETMETLS
jgi:anthranilate synthase component 1